MEKNYGVTGLTKNHWPGSARRGKAHVPGTMGKKINLRLRGLLSGLKYRRQNIKNCYCDPHC
jgi:hypothetical protein